MIIILSSAALVLSVLYYAIRASEVRLESAATRKRKRWISGLAILVLAPVVAFLTREPGVDRGMLGLLVGLLVVCAVMFAASFLGTRKNEESA